MKKAVLGFLTTKTHVLLVRKPDSPWNGIGGDILPEESPADAMVRLVRETVGIVTDSDDWREVVRLMHEGDETRVYRALGNPFAASMQTDARPVIFALHGLDWAREPVQTPLKWLAPLALADDIAEPPTVTVR